MWGINIIYNNISGWNLQIIKKTAIKLNIFNRVMKKFINIKRV